MAVWRRAHLDSYQCADREYSYPVTLSGIFRPGSAGVQDRRRDTACVYPRFPANELVMPLIVMGYLSSGTIASGVDFASLPCAAAGKRLDGADRALQNNWCSLGARAVLD